MQYSMVARAKRIMEVESREEEKRFSFSWSPSEHKLLIAATGGQTQTDCLLVLML